MLTHFEGTVGTAAAEAFFGGFVFEAPPEAHGEILPNGDSVAPNVPTR